MRLSVDLQRIDRLSRIISVGTVLGLFLLLLTLSMVNRIILKRLWQPFYDALAAMKNFRLEGESAAGFPETNIEEFAFMIQNLEASTQKIREEYHVLKQFTEHASHELQTPLAIIRSKLDLLIQDEGLSEQQSLIIRSAYGPLKKLSRLNQSLLLLAKIENRLYDRREETNLVVVIEEKLDQFQELVKNNDFRIATNFHRNSPILINPELADILISNLLGNAIRHNIPGGTIQIELFESTLQISNPGNTPLDEDRLFKRFYKGSAAGHGVGLGLYIVLQICHVTGIGISYRFADHSHVFSLTWATTPVTENRNLQNRITFGA